MSESYHDQWQVMFDNQKIQGKINSWIPWAKPDKISDADHFKLNNFLNAWYIDVYKLCQQENKCQPNEDGSYNLDMQIEFWPQRLFYLGLIISGMTLIGCLGYLVWGRSKN